MFYLIVAILMWSMSFGLIGKFLSGQVDLELAMAIRFALALAIFLPMLKLKTLGHKKIILLMAIGGIQIGLMYVFYFNSFLYLTPSEVALFTVTTPLYVAISAEFWEKKWATRPLLFAMLSMVGAMIIRWNQIEGSFLLGLILVQSSNICFALGQVAYKKFFSNQNEMNQEKHFFALFYAGALLAILPLILSKIGQDVQWPIHFAQWGTLLWLGVGASGLGYFFWNSGSKKVSMTTMAVMNNALVPMALIVTLVFFDGVINFLPFTIGSCIIAIAVYQGRKVY